MKKELIFSIAVLFTFPAMAQSAGFVRKQSSPEFFIPQNELNKKESLPVIAVKRESVAGGGKRQEEAIQPPKELEDVEECPVEKENVDTFSNSSKIYKKTYDEYLQDLEYIKRNNKIPESADKERDLSKLTSEEIIIIK